MKVTRQELAHLFGISPSTMLRWETHAEGHRPYGLQLAVLALLERAIAGGRIVACCNVVSLARTDLPEALWRLVVAERGLNEGDERGHA